MGIHNLNQLCSVCFYQHLVSFKPIILFLCCLFQRFVISTQDDNATLYAELLAEVARVLSPRGGRACLFTAFGKGHMGSALMGSLRMLCFMAEILFGTPVKSTFPRKPGRTFCPIRPKFIAFAAPPWVLTPFFAVIIAYYILYYITCYITLFHSNMFTYDMLPYTKASTAGNSAAMSRAIV